MLKVLIAEDTLLVAQVIKLILEQNGDIQVVGIAENGSEALRLVTELRPDLVTMDIHMPVMDGLTAIQEIMAVAPLPIIVISATVDPAQQHDSFEAIDAGALSVLPKPPAFDSTGFVEYSRTLINQVRAMAEIKVVRRTLRRHVLPPVSSAAEQKTPVARHVVLLGASTGGPNALHTLLAPLPANFPLPIVIVQHITRGFLSGLVEWMQSKCQLRVKIAEHDEVLRPGVVYFAADDKHIELRSLRQQLRIALVHGEVEAGFRPSVNHLFHAVAGLAPSAVIAGLLTGMGTDGASGMLALRRGGAFTFAQDEASCVVFGMPGAALQSGAVMETWRLEEMASALRDLARKQAAV